MFPWIIAAILLASLFSWKRTRVKIFAVDSSDSFKNRTIINSSLNNNNNDGTKKVNSSSSEPPVIRKKTTLFELASATSIVKFLMGKDPTSSPNQKTQKTDEKEGESEKEPKQNCEKEWNLRDNFAAEEDMRNVKWINHIVATFLVSEGLQKQLEQKVNQALRDQISRLENSNPDLLRKSQVKFQMFQHHHHHHHQRDENGSGQVNNNSINNHQKNPLLHQEILTSSETILKNILPFRFHKIQVVNQSSSTGFNNFPESPNHLPGAENPSTLMSSLRVSLELALGPTSAPSRSVNKQESENPITNLIDKIFGEQNAAESRDENSKSSPTKNPSGNNIIAGAPTTFSNVSLDFSAQVGVGFGRFLPFAIRISDFWSSIIKLHLQIDIYPGEDEKENNNNNNNGAPNNEETNKHEAKKSSNDIAAMTTGIEDEQRLLFEDDDDEIPGTKKTTSAGASSDYGSSTNFKNQQRRSGTTSQPSNLPNVGDADDEAEHEKPPNVFPPNRVPLKAVVTGYIGELGDSEFELRTSLGGMSIGTSSLIDQHQNNNHNNHKPSLLDSFLMISLCDWAPIVLLLEKRLNDLIKKFIVVKNDDKNEDGKKKSNGQDKIDRDDVKSNKKPLFKITVPLPSSAPEY